MSQEEAKRRVAEAAAELVGEDTIVGVGTGSTVNCFIDVLGRRKSRISGAVSSSNATSERLRAIGIRVLELNRRSRLDVWRWQPLSRLLRSGRIDVVHAHKFASNLWGALLVPRSPLPLLLAHEHTWSYEGMLRRVVDRELIGRRARARKDASSKGCSGNGCRRDRAQSS